MTDTPLFGRGAPIPRAAPAKAPIARTEPRGLPTAASPAPLARATPAPAATPATGKPRGYVHPFGLQPIPPPNPEGVDAGVAAYTFPSAADLLPKPRTGPIVFPYKSHGPEFTSRDARYMATSHCNWFWAGVMMECADTIDALLAKIEKLQQQ